MNRQGKAFSDYIGIKELSCTVPLKTSGSLSYTFGAAGDPDTSGTLTGNDAVRLLQLASTEYTVGGRTLAGGRDDLSRRLGWADVSDGTIGLATGLRYFWQLYPKGFQLP